MFRHHPETWKCCILLELYHFFCVPDVSKCDKIKETLEKSNVFYLKSLNNFKKLKSLKRLEGPEAPHMAGQTWSGADWTVDGSQRMPEPGSWLTLGWCVTRITWVFKQSLLPDTAIESLRVSHFPNTVITGVGQQPLLLINRTGLD